MKNIIDQQQNQQKQNAPLERMESLLAAMHPAQLVQTEILDNTNKSITAGDNKTHAKLDKIINLEEKRKIVEKNDAYKKLDLINKNIEEGLLGNRSRGLNFNVLNLFNEVKKQTKQISALKPLSSAQTSTILDKSRERREFKTIGTRLEGTKEKVKDFFTARGFLDKTGIVKRGTGGIISERLDAREAVQKRVQARISAGDPTVKLHGVEGARKIFTKQETTVQQLRRDQGKDERRIEQYKRLGVSAATIEKSPESKRLKETAIKLAKVDPSLRPEGFDVKSGMVRATKSVEKSITPTVTRETPNTNRRNKSNPTNPIGMFITPMNAMVTEETSSSKITALKEDKKTKKEKVSTVDPLIAQESALEAQRSRDLQTQLLSKIEENTSAIAGKGESKSKAGKPEEGSGGILSNIMGFLSDGLMGALKFIFNPKNILKLLSKIALPAMIIGSLVNGIMDGFKAFTETGSIGEALIAGLGGVLSFLSFGLFDAETVRNIVDSVSGFVDEYIIEPVKKFFNFIGDTFQKYIVEPLATFFEPIANFFKSIKDQILSMVESIGIPEISFTIPIIDKKVSIGPFFPFKKESAAPVKSAGALVSGGGGNFAGAGAGGSWTEDTKANKIAAVSAAAPVAKSADIVSKKTTDNIESAASQKSQAPVIVSAPTTNNTSTTRQNITSPPPIRNSDEGFNAYKGGRSVFI